MRHHRQVVSADWFDESAGHCLTLDLVQGLNESITVQHVIPPFCQVSQAFPFSRGTDGI